VLPGIVLAYMLGLPLAIGAFAAGMVCALATGYLKENSRVKEDTVMGVVFSGMFGSASCSTPRSRPTCISTTSCSATCSASPGAT
jgi:ABC-type Mn2+/Zn2+ transport system permease subunit